MTLEFHYIKGGRAFGPVDEGDFLTKLADGVIADGDLVRIDGGLAWTPAYEVVTRLRAGMLRPAVHSSKPAMRRAAGSMTVFTSAPPEDAAQPEPTPVAGHAPVVEAQAPKKRPGIKKCTHCGCRTAREAAYCHRCGGDLSLWTCDGCFSKVERGAKFCGHCGKAL